MPVDPAALAGLRERDVTRTVAFTVEPDQTTTVFGEQSDPPGLPAATDVALGESVRVLGTPHMLARFEFCARESLRGSLPAGAGVVGESMSVEHRRGVPVGAEVAVRTELAAVDPPTLSFDCRATSDGRGVGTATVTLRAVERDAFQASVDGGFENE